MTKECNVCFTVKAVTEFYKHAYAKYGVQNYCKACAADLSRRYRAKNKDKVNKWDRDRYVGKGKRSTKSKPKKTRYEVMRGNQLKTVFGLTLDDFKQMSAKQDGKCYLCLKVPKDSLAVDHCHKTGKIRKLLCRKCNSALGFVNEDLETIKRMIDYVTDHR